MTATSTATSTAGPTTDAARLAAPARRARTAPLPRPVGLPTPRGPVSAAVVDVLASGSTTPADARRTTAAELERRALGADEVLRDEDLQLALWTLQELSFRGFGGAGDRFEWDLELVGARQLLEGALEAALRQVVDVPTGVAPSEVPEVLFAMTADDGAPGMSDHLARRGTLEQFRELVVHRSIYHLKEADPHTWAIPRLEGSVKAAMVEIQADEYGGGRPERMHAALFARTMRALGLDDTYGLYVDEVPATTLVGSTAMALFGLNRRLVGAVVGHLAAIEMTSSLPSRRYGAGMRRLGLDRDATWFYDEHVEADAVHEQIAAHDLAGGFARQHPDRTSEVLLGAAAGLALDELVGGHLRSSWEAGRSSLLGGRAVDDLLAAAAA
ncbi:iron-containing redox enzyme family protein [uncultured Pseudokineococcus sp.]|uniref:iron-containing redox enzyme family protein n=1 Tax=uncultured Pseudokineococcus sp. TaxID=1642928 RepID=UPI00261E8A31|nr:iron-containing redox enzyme family protein [uncultured Pseudokineococcus sp.]